MAGFATHMIKPILKFFDLDHPVKVAFFAAEIIPIVGIIYAIVGHRPNVAKDAVTGEDVYMFEKLTIVDRLIYLFGEAFLSGHLVRGAKQSILARMTDNLMVRAKRSLAGKNNEPPA
jgi:hypothetical protein